MDGYIWMVIWFDVAVFGFAQGSLDVMTTVTISPFLKKEVE